MPVPTKDDIRQHVREGFNARDQPLPPSPGDEAIVSIALGLLRQLANPSGGRLAALATQVFGALPVSGQLAQDVVDFFLDGRRDDPPFPDREELEPILESWFSESGTPTPGPAELAVLVNIEVGILQDQFPNGPMAAREAVGAVLAKAHADGQ